MSTKVHVNSHLHDFTKEWTVEAEGSTLREVISSLEGTYPGVQAVIYDKNADRIRPGFSVFVNGSQARLLDTEVPQNSEVLFQTQIAGG